MLGLTVVILQDFFSLSMYFRLTNPCIPCGIEEKEKKNKQGHGSPRERLDCLENLG